MTGKSRNDHRWTAHAAAREIDDVQPTQRARLLAFIQSRGDEGATDQEACDALRMDPSSVRPRRVELIEQGKVSDSGRVRKTRAGREAAVWVAADSAAKPTQGSLFSDTGDYYEQED